LIAPRFLLSLVLAGAPGTAQEAARVGEREIVGEIVFEGQSRILEERLRTELKTRVGEELTQKKLDEDLKVLYRKFRIEATLKRKEKLPDGRVRVVLFLSDAVTVRRFEFAGNRRIKTEKLQDLLRLSESGYLAGGVTGSGQFRPMLRKIEQLYEDEGHLYAEIGSRLVEREGEKILEFHILEGPEVEVDEIRFEGLKTFRPADLRDLMDSKQSFLFIGHSFKRRELERDIAVIEDFLEDEGFLDARVSLEALEPEDSATEVDVVLRVEEGPRYRVGSLKFDGNRHFSEAELAPLIRMKPGDIYKATTYARDRRALLKYLGQRGYIDARMDEEHPKESYDLSKPIVNLVYFIDEGLPKRLRDVRVVGNSNTADEVVRREMEIYPGQIFDIDELNRTEDRLKASGFFTDDQGQPRVDVRTEAVEDPRYKDVVIDVEDGPSGFINFLAGLGSGNGFFVGVEITKENFDYKDLPSSPWAFFPEFFDQRAFHGGGQRFKLRANPGNERSDYAVQFIEPYLTGPVERPWFLDVEGHLRKQFLRLYDEDRLGAHFQVGKHLTRDTRLSFGFRFDTVEITDVQQNVPDLVEVEGTNHVRGMTSRFVSSDLDSLRNPTHGWIFDLNGEMLGGPFGAEYDVYKLVTRAEMLYPIYENKEEQRHVLALRGVVAYANEFDNTEEVPIFERYFAGGAGTLLQIRGFEVRGVGPRQSDEPVGGAGGFVLNNEYVFPVYDYYESRLRENVPFVRGVLFSDLGSLETDFEDLKGSLVRISVGAGVRLRIPIQILAAPLEMYYGVPLQKDDDDERQAFTVSFSTRF